MNPTIRQLAYLLERLIHVEQACPPPHQQCHQRPGLPPRHCWPWFLAAPTTTALGHAADPPSSQLQNTRLDGLVGAGEHTKRDQRSPKYVLWHN